MLNRPIRISPVANIERKLFALLMREVQIRSTSPIRDYEASPQFVSADLSMMGGIGV